ncbi:MAG: elongation factor G [bacterium]|nr:elongation factor G [bacterium]
MSLQPQNIRNVSIIGHGGTGKTTLSEALLFDAKLTNRLGRVDDGNTVLDFDPGEIERKISISAGLSYLNWRDHKINLIDTPGYMDFIGEVIRSLRAIDSSIVLVDAIHGVEVGTEIVWNYANEQNLPRMIFVNKMDKENANFYKCLDGIKEVLETEASIVPVQLPMGEAVNFKGVLDLIKLKAYTYKDGKEQVGEIPKEDLDKVNELREKLVEAVAETSDELTEKYLEGMGLDEKELLIGLTNGIKSGKIIPVVCGSSYNNMGVNSLLDMVIDFLPSPLERGDTMGIKPDEKRPCSLTAPFSALVFKIISDPYIGEMSLFRVYSGTIHPGEELYNPSKNQKEKVPQICLVMGKNRSEVHEIGCGDIGALVKFKGATTGDTLCSHHSPIEFVKITFPESTTEVAINPKTKQDQEKMSLALSRLHEEDPTFKIRYDPELGQTIVSGMSELHIDIILTKLQKKFGAEVNIEKPKVPYREAIKSQAKGEGKYKRQTGGRGQYGHALIEIEPIALNSETSFEFVNKIFGGAVPAKYIPPIEKGVKEKMGKGILAGYPILWVRVTLNDGSFHEVDSSDIAFQLAGSFAFEDAFQKANPVLLEPVMEVDVKVPDEYMGSVVGDLNSRRGRISGMEPMGRTQVVKASVPQAEMYKYSTSLRSITHGRGVYHAQFSHYEEIPHQLAEKIIQQAQEAKKG